MGGLCSRPALLGALCGNRRAFHGYIPYSVVPYGIKCGEIRRGDIYRALYTIFFGTLFLRALESRTGRSRHENTYRIDDRRVTSVWTADARTHTHTQKEPSKGNQLRNCYRRDERRTRVWRIGNAPTYRSSFHRWNPSPPSPTTIPSFWCPRPARKKQSQSMKRALHGMSFESLPIFFLSRRVVGDELCLPLGIMAQTQLL